MASIDMKDAITPSPLGLQIENIYVLSGKEIYMNLLAFPMGCHVLPGALLKFLGSP